jgi:hypothetical protein
MDSVRQSLEASLDETSMELSRRTLPGRGGSDGWARLARPCGRPRCVQGLYFLTHGDIRPWGDNLRPRRDRGHAPRRLHVLYWTVSMSRRWVVAGCYQQKDSPSLQSNRYNLPRSPNRGFVSSILRESDAEAGFVSSISRWKEVEEVVPRFRALIASASQHPSLLCFFAHCERRGTSHLP